MNGHSSHQIKGAKSLTQSNYALNRVVTKYRTGIRI